LELSYRYQIPIVEDDPYSELRYDGNHIPSLKALDRHEHAIYMSTVSKVLFFGFRIGWVAAPPQVIDKFANLKQITDLQVNTPSQLVLDKYLRQGHFEEHLMLVRKEYSHRRDVMIEALEKYGLPNVSWNKPQGGYYVWCRLPDKVNQTRLIVKALEEGVVYVPGEICFPNGTQGESYARLNFSFIRPDQIKGGIKRLMEAVCEVEEETGDTIQDIERYRKPIV